MSQNYQDLRCYPGRHRSWIHLETWTPRGSSIVLGLKTQETSRHLSRLEEARLVEKNLDGTYKLTNYGELILGKHGELDFLAKYKDYFRTHSLRGVPRELIASIGVLSNADFIDDVMVSLQSIQRIIDESEEYFWRITDQFVMVILDRFVAATDRGVEYRQIYPKNIKLPPNFEETVKLRPARRAGLFKTHTHENVRVFMILSEKEVGILSFPNLEGEFDYKGFTSKDPYVLEWCKELFEYYWKERLPPLQGVWDAIPEEN